MMEKQTYRKIKMIQIDHVGEYKDRVLQFGQNTDIGIHFTVDKYGVDKEMNVPYWRKFSVCCLMHH